MKLERTKNTKRNVVYGAAFRIIDIALAFVNRTILLKVLGVNYLGLNSLFISILSVLGLADLGFGTAIVYCLYKPIADDDTETVSALLILYKKIYRWIGIIILIVGVSISPFLRQLIAGDVPEEINLPLIFFIHLINVVISYFCFAYKDSVLSAYQREDIISKVSSVTLILQYLVQFILLFITKNYYAYLIVIPCVTVLKNIIKFIIASKLFSEGRITTNKQLDTSVKQEIKTKVKALFLHKIGGVIANSLDSVVISSFIGLTVTAIYNNYYYIMVSVGNTVAIFYTAILAGLGNSVVCESKDNNYEKYKKLSFVNNWLVSWCSICMLCLYQPFMRLWMGDNYLFPNHTAILFAVYFFVNWGRRINVTFKDACGIWVEDRFKPLISGIINIILNIILIQIIGVDGVVLSTIISFAVIEIPWEVYVLYKSYFKKDIRDYYIQWLKNICVELIVATITYSISSYFITVDNKIWYIIITGIICITIPNMLFIVIWRNKIKMIVDYIKR